MNYRKILPGVFAVIVLLLSACGDDEKSSPKQQFTFEDGTISLKDVNLFLTDDEFYDGETGNYREYIITDGDANGTGATFYIEVELGNEADEVLVAGTYPQYENWSEAPDNSNVSYIYSEIGDGDDYMELYPTDDANGDDDVVISGGMEDGETMTLKFNGTLMLYYFDGANWVDKEVTGKFYFKGEVDDVTSAPAKTEKAFPGRKTVRQ